MEPGPVGLLCAINLGGVDVWIYILTIVLLGCSAFFSACEMAFTTINQIRLKSLADDNVRGARKAMRVIENYDKTLSTILIGNNLVNIGLTTICAYIFTTLISNPTLSSAINTVVMTIIILTFGEILPKTCVKVDPQKFALRFAGIMSVLIKLLTPISFLFLKLQKVATKKVKTVTSSSPTITEVELESLINTMEIEGVINRDRANIMQNVLELPSLTAFDIMTPRVDVSAINYADSVTNIRDMFMDTMYSRLPVYDENIDKIIGVLNQKDFFKAMLSGEKVYIKKIMSEPLYINGNMKVDDIIKKMQINKKHLAVVLDEHGGTSGIVCMEDALEVMVGQISDEHDNDKALIDKQSDNEYVVNPDMPLHEFFDLLEIERLPETEYKSVGGFVFGLTQELPQTDKVIVFKTVDERLSNGVYISVPVEIHFTLTDVEDNRIKQMHVKVVDINK